MGGGTRDIKEVLKSSSLSPRNDASSGSPDESVDLSLPLCERSQQLRFVFGAGVEIALGDPVSIARATPPAIVLRGQVIGQVSDGRDAQTISACLDAGYSIVGDVTMVNADLNEGLAAVAGIRSRE